MTPNRKHVTGFFLFSILIVMSCLFSAARSDELPANQFVEQFSVTVLEAIKARKQELIDNPEQLNVLIDEMVMPNVDFRKMTQLVVGRSWRDATPEQREEIIRQFRVLLVKTYSGALSQLQDQTIEVDRLRARPEDTNVIVTSRVIQKSGPPIDLAYRVQKGEDGWKIYDLSVLGLWIVDSYKNQFQPLLNASGVEGLISALKTKNNPT